MPRYKKKTVLGLYKKKKYRQKLSQNAGPMSPKAKRVCLIKSPNVKRFTVKKRCITFSPQKTPKRKRLVFTTASEKQCKRTNSPAKALNWKKKLNFGSENCTLDSKLNLECSGLTISETAPVSTLTAECVGTVDECLETGENLKCDQTVETENEISDTIERLERLVKEGKFSTSCIAYKLFEDTLKWYDSDNTSCMRYSEETKEFFWTGKRLLGGQFIRFMRGITHEGLVNERQANLGYYNPDETEINLPVPSDFTLRNYQPKGILTMETTEPGIIRENIEMYGQAMGDSSFVVMFDGKKIIPQSADVFFLGKEEPKLSEIKKQHEMKVKILKEYKAMLQEPGNSGLSGVLHIPTEAEKNEYIDSSKVVISVIGSIIRDLRHMYAKKAIYLQASEKKLIETVDAKYKYVCNKIRTVMYQFSICIKGLLEVVDIIIGSCADVQKKGHLYKKTQCNLTTQENYRELRDDLNSQFENLPVEYLKQRSPEWFKLRDTVKVTGSVAHVGIGLETLSAQKKFFDSKFGKKPTDSMPVTKEARTAMDHGTENEINAVATLVSKVMPVYYPNFEFHEEGAYQIKDEDGDTLMIISPDGTLRQNDNIVSIEIKCPYSTYIGSTPVYYQFKDRHVVQSLLEAHVTKAADHLYISWSKESTTVFRVKPRPDIVHSVIKEVKDTYYSEIPIRPSRISDRTKSLKEEVHSTSSTAEFLGEFPSLVSNSTARCPQTTLNNVYYKQEKDTGGYKQCINETNTLIENAHRAIMLVQEAFHYQKPVASEVLVHLLRDMNRLYHKEVCHGLPISYLFKGYSLTMPTSRKILDEVLDECKEHNVHTPCTTFDGQFFKLKDYSENDTPLTLFAMHRKVWTDVKKMNKKQLIDHIEELYQETVQDIVTENDVSDDGILIERRKYLNVQNRKLLCLPIETAHRVLKHKRDEKRNTGREESVVDLEVKEADGFDDEVMQLLGTVEAVVDADEISVTAETDSSIAGNAEDTLDLLGSQQIPPETDKVSSDNTVRLVTFDFENILKILVKSKRQKWKDCTLSRLIEIFQSAKVMNSELINDELNEIVKYLTIKLSEAGITIRKNLRKAEKINKLCNSIGMHEELQIAEVRRKKRNAEFLRSLCRRALNKKEYPKEALAISYARSLWPVKEQEWYNSSAVSDVMTILDAEKDTEIEIKPIYSPEYCQNRQQFEVRVMDGTHIRTNIKSKLIRHGLGRLKINAWKKVAEAGKSHLRPAMLEVQEDGKILHQQSDPYVRTMFCEEVEKEMQINGDMEEAQFCRLFRRWHEAEDKPGISAFDRCLRASELRSWLMDSYDFTRFPPPSQYVKGIPRITFEGLMCSIDAHFILYKLVKGGTYNWRSVSTLVAESFMGELAERAANSHGVPSGQNIASDMCKISQLHAMRLKPDRPFKMKTAKSRCYETPEDVSLQSDEYCYLQPPVVERPIRSITVRNHTFDIRKPHRAQVGKVSAILDVPRGVQSVRTYYKVDESKILPSLRLGVREDELNEVLKFD